MTVADAVPTAVRGAEGIPFPTRRPDGSDDVTAGSCVC